MPGNKKNLKIRILSAFVAVCFFLTQHGIPVSAQETPSIMAAASFPSDLGEIRIPPNIGKLEESSNAGERLVILVQDAHAIPDAQKNIRNIIDFFQEKYGLDTVALEGTTAKLNARIFRSFPDKQLLKDVFSDYLHQGELTGTAMAAIFNKREARFEGIEDLKLYEEGYAYYLDTLERREKIETILADQNKKLVSEKERAYSSALLEVDRALKDFHSGDLDLMKVIELLAAIQPPPAGSELELLLKEKESGGESRAPIETEVKSLAHQIKEFFMAKPFAGKREAVTAFNEKLQAFQTSQLTAEEFAVYLKDLCRDMKLPFQFSGDLSARVKEQKKIQDIEGTRFFGQFEEYARRVKESLMKSSLERGLDRETQRLYLLERLAKMELTRQQWHQVTSFANHGEFIGPNNIQLTTEDTERLIPEPDLRKLFSSHLLFYRNSEARDEVFVKNILGLMKGRPRAAAGRQAVLLVAGGFHTEGLISRLKKEGVSYFLIMPGIKSLPDEISYVDHMRGLVSWKDYFELENGKVNVYKAFVRHTRDKLMELAAQPMKGITRSGNILKEWRDSIIRDLAAQGQIAEAGQYTRFIDEKARPGGEADQEKDLSEKMERFVAGLKDLEARGQLSEQNIMRLLRPAAITDMVTYRVLEDALVDISPALASAQAADASRGTAASAPEIKTLAETGPVRSELREEQEIAQDLLENLTREWETDQRSKVGNEISLVVTNYSQNYIDRKLDTRIILESFAAAVRGAKDAKSQLIALTALRDALSRIRSSTFEAQSYDRIDIIENIAQLFLDLMENPGVGGEDVRSLAESKLAYMGRDFPFLLPILFSKLADLRKRQEQASRGSDEVLEARLKDRADLFENRMRDSANGVAPFANEKFQEAMQATIPFSLALMNISLKDAATLYGLPESIEDYFDLNLKGLLYLGSAANADNTSRIRGLGKDASAKVSFKYRVMKLLWKEFQIEMEGITQRILADQNLQPAARGQTFLSEMQGVIADYTKLISMLLEGQTRTNVDNLGRLFYGDDETARKKAGRWLVWLELFGNESAKRALKSQDALRKELAQEWKAQNEELNRELGVRSELRNFDEDPPKEIPEPDSAERKPDGTGALAAGVRSKLDALSVRSSVFSSVKGEIEALMPEIYPPARELALREVEARLAASPEASAADILKAIRPFTALEHFSLGDFNRLPTFYQDIPGVPDGRIFHQRAGAKAPAVRYLPGSGTIIVNLDVMPRDESFQYMAGSERGRFRRILRGVYAASYRLDAERGEGFFSSGMHDTEMLKIPGLLNRLAVKNSFFRKIAEEYFAGKVSTIFRMTGTAHVEKYKRISEYRNLFLFYKLLAPFVLLSAVLRALFRGSYEADGETIVSPRFNVSKYSSVQNGYRIMTEHEYLLNWHNLKKSPEKLQLWQDLNAALSPIRDALLPGYKGHFLELTGRFPDTLFFQSRPAAEQALEVYKANSAAETELGEYIRSTAGHYLIQYSIESGQTDLLIAAIEAYTGDEFRAEVAPVVNFFFGRGEVEVSLTNNNYKYLREMVDEVSAGKADETIARFTAFIGRRLVPEYLENFLRFRSKFPGYLGGVSKIHAIPVFERDGVPLSIDEMLRLDPVRDAGLLKTGAFRAVSELSDEERNAFYERSDPDAGSSKDSLAYGYLRDNAKALLVLSFLKYNESVNHSSDADARANARNRTLKEEHKRRLAEQKNLNFYTGAYIHGVQPTGEQRENGVTVNANALGAILQGGNFAGELLGLEIRTDSFPMNVDLSKLGVRKADSDRKGGLPQTHFPDFEAHIRNSDSLSFGPVFLLYGEDEIEGAPGILRPASVPRTTGWAQRLTFGLIPRDRLTGLIAAGLDETNLQRLKQTAAKSPFYVPVYDEKGKVLLEEAEYDRLHAVAAAIPSPLPAGLKMQPFPAAVSQSIDAGSGEGLEEAFASASRLFAGVYAFAGITQESRGLLSGHMREVLKSTAALPEFAGLGKARKYEVLLAALFHDLGKISPENLASVPRLGISIESLKKMGHNERSEMIARQVFEEGRFAVKPGSITRILLSVRLHSFVTDKLFLEGANVPHPVEVSKALVSQLPAGMEPAEQLKLLEVLRLVNLADAALVKSDLLNPGSEAGSAFKKTYDLAAKRISDISAEARSELRAEANDFIVVDAVALEEGYLSFDEGEDLLGLSAGTRAAAAAVRPEPTAEQRSAQLETISMLAMIMDAGNLHPLDQLRYRLELERNIGALYPELYFHGTDSSVLDRIIGWVVESGNPADAKLYSADELEKRDIKLSAVGYSPGQISFADWDARALAAGSTQKRVLMNQGSYPVVFARASQPADPKGSSRSYQPKGEFTAGGESHFDAVFVPYARMEETRGRLDEAGLETIDVLPFEFFDKTWGVDPAESSVRTKAKTFSSRSELRDGEEESPGEGIPAEKIRMPDAMERFDSGKAVLNIFTKTGALVQTVKNIHGIDLSAEDVILMEVTRYTNSRQKDIFKAAVKFMDQGVERQVEFLLFYPARESSLGEETRFEPVTKVSKDVPRFGGVFVTEIDAGSGRMRRAPIVTAELIPGENLFLLQQKLGPAEKEYYHRQAVKMFFSMYEASGRRIFIDDISLGQVVLDRLEGGEWSMKIVDLGSVRILTSGELSASDVLDYFSGAFRAPIPGMEESDWVWSRKNEKTGFFDGIIDGMGREAGEKFIREAAAFSDPARAYLADGINRYAALPDQAPKPASAQEAEVFEPAPLDKAPAAPRDLKQEGAQFALALAAWVKLNPGLEGLRIPERDILNVYRHLTDAAREADVLSHEAALDFFWKEAQAYLRKQLAITIAGGFSTQTLQGHLISRSGYKAPPAPKLAAPYAENALKSLLSEDGWTPAAFNLSLRTEGSQLTSYLERTGLMLDSEENLRALEQTFEALYNFQNARSELRDGNESDSQQTSGEDFLSTFARAFYERVAERAEGEAPSGSEARNRALVEDVARSYWKILAGLNEGSKKIYFERYFERIEYILFSAETIFPFLEAMKNIHDGLESRFGGEDGETELKLKKDFFRGASSHIIAIADHRNRESARMYERNPVKGVDDLKDFFGEIFAAWDGSAEKGTARFRDNGLVFFHLGLQQAVQQQLRAAGLQKIGWDNLKKFLALPQIEFGGKTYERGPAGVSSDEAKAEFVEGKNPIFRVTLLDREGGAAKNILVKLGVEQPAFDEIVTEVTRSAGGLETYSVDRFGPDGSVPLQLIEFVPSRIVYAAARARMGSATIYSDLAAFNALEQNVKLKALAELGGQLAVEYLLGGKDSVMKHFLLSDGGRFFKIDHEYLFQYDRKSSLAGTLEASSDFWGFLEAIKKDRPLRGWDEEAAVRRGFDALLKKAAFNEEGFRDSMLRIISDKKIPEGTYGINPFDMQKQLEKRANHSFEMLRGLARTQDARSELRVTAQEILAAELPGVFPEAGGGSIAYADFGSGLGSFLRQFNQKLNAMGAARINAVAIEMDEIEHKASILEDAKKRGEEAAGKGVPLEQISEITFVEGSVESAEKLFEGNPAKIAPASFDLVTINAPDITDDRVDFNKWLDTAKALLKPDGLILVRFFDYAGREARGQKQAAEWRAFEAVLAARTDLGVQVIPEEAGPADMPEGRHSLLNKTVLIKNAASPFTQDYVALAKAKADDEARRKAAPAEILAAYGLAGASVTPHPDPTKQHIVTVAADKGTFILKQPKYRNTEDLIAWENSVLTALGENAAQIVKTTDGKLLTRSGDGTVYVLYEKAEGAEFGWGEVEGAPLESAAVLLAGLHQRLENFEAAGMNYAPESRPQVIGVLEFELGLKRLEELFASLSERGPPNSEAESFFLTNAALIADTVLKIRSRLTPEVLSRLPASIVHGDYHQGNMRDSKLFDFEYAARDARIYDLANPLMIRYAADGSSLAFDKVETFILAYHKNNPLTETELDLLADIFRLRYLEGVLLFAGQLGKKDWAGKPLNEQIQNLKILDAQDWAGLKQKALARSELRVDQAGETEEENAGIANPAAESLEQYGGRYFPETQRQKEKAVQDLIDTNEKSQARFVEIETELRRLNEIMAAGDREIENLKSRIRQTRKSALSTTGRAVGFMPAAEKTLRRSFGGQIRLRLKAKTAIRRTSEERETLLTVLSGLRQDLLKARENLRLFYESLAGDFENRSLALTAKKYNRFVMHGFLHERGVSQIAPNSNVRDNLSYKTKLKMLLALKPTVSAYTFQPSEEDSSSMYSRIGVILADGFIEMAASSDAGSVVQSLWQRNYRGKDLDRPIEGQLDQAIYEHASGWNELGVRSPQVAGVYFYMGETNILTPEDALPLNEIFEVAEAYGLPVYAVTNKDVREIKYDAAARRPVIGEQAVTPGQISERPFKFSGRTEWKTSINQLIEENPFVESRSVDLGEETLQREIEALVFSSAGQTISGKKWTEAEAVKRREDYFKAKRQAEISSVAPELVFEAESPANPYTLEVTDTTDGRRKTFVRYPDGAYSNTVLSLGKNDYYPEILAGYRSGKDRVSERVEGAVLALEALESRAGANALLLESRELKSLGDPGITAREIASGEIGRMAEELTEFLLSRGYYYPTWEMPNYFKSSDLAFQKKADGTWGLFIAVPKAPEKIPDNWMAGGKIDPQKAAEYKRNFREALTRSLAAPHFLGTYLESLSYQPQDDRTNEVWEKVKQALTHFLSSSLVKTEDGLEYVLHYDPAYRLFGIYPAGSPVSERGRDSWLGTFDISDINAQPGLLSFTHRVQLNQKAALEALEKAMLRRLSDFAPDQVETQLVMDLTDPATIAWLVDEAGSEPGVTVPDRVRDYAEKHRRQGYSARVSRSWDASADALSAISFLTSLFADNPAFLAKINEEGSLLNTQLGSLLSHFSSRISMETNPRNEYEIKIIAGRAPFESGSTGRSDLRPTANAVGQESDRSTDPASDVPGPESLNRVDPGSTGRSDLRTAAVTLANLLNDKSNFDKNRRDIFARYLALAGAAPGGSPGGSSDAALTLPLMGLVTALQGYDSDEVEKTLEEVNAPLLARRDVVLLRTGRAVNSSFEAVSGQSFREMKQAAAQLSLPAGTRLERLLIVEDNELFAEAYSRWRPFGITPVVLETPELARAALASDKFDFVILDVDLAEGGVTGIDLFNQFRDTGNQTPVLFVTARSMDQMDGVKNWANAAHLIKPAAFEGNFSVLSTLLGDVRAKSALSELRDTQEGDPQIYFEDILTSPGESLPWEKIDFWKKTGEGRSELRDEKKPGEAGGEEKFNSFGQFFSGVLEPLFDDDAGLEHVTLLDRRDEETGVLFLEVERVMSDFASSTKRGVDKEALKDMFRISDFAPDTFPAHLRDAADETKLLWIFYRIRQMGNKNPDHDVLDPTQVGKGPGAGGFLHQIAVLNPPSSVLQQGFVGEVDEDQILEIRQEMMAPDPFSKPVYSKIVIKAQPAKGYSLHDLVQISRVSLTEEEYQKEFPAFRLKEDLDRNFEMNSILKTFVENAVLRSTRPREIRQDLFFRLTTEKISDVFFNDDQIAAEVKRYLQRGLAAIDSGELLSADREKEIFTNLGTLFEWVLTLSGVDMAMMAGILARLPISADAKNQGKESGAYRFYDYVLNRLGSDAPESSRLQAWHEKIRVMRLPILLETKFRSDAGSGRSELRESQSAPLDIQNILIRTGFKKESQLRSAVLLANSPSKGGKERDKDWAGRIFKQIKVTPGETPVSAGIVEFTSGAIEYEMLEIVYFHEKQPVAVARLASLGSQSSSVLKWQLHTIAADRSRGILAARAVKAIAEKALEYIDDFYPGSAELSPDGAALINSAVNRMLGKLSDEELKALGVNDGAVRSELRASAAAEDEDSGAEARVLERLERAEAKSRWEPVFWQQTRLQSLKATFTRNLVPADLPAFIVKDNGLEAFENLTLQAGKKAPAGKLHSEYADIGAALKRSGISMIFGDALRYPAFLKELQKEMKSPAPDMERFLKERQIYFLKDGDLELDFPAEVPAAKKALLLDLAAKRLETLLNVKKGDVNFREKIALFTPILAKVLIKFANANARPGLQWFELEDRTLSHLASSNMFIVPNFGSSYAKSSGTPYKWIPFLREWDAILGRAQAKAGRPAAILPLLSSRSQRMLIESTPEAALYYFDRVVSVMETLPPEIPADIFLDKSLSYSSAQIDFKARIIDVDEDGRYTPAAIHYFFNRVDKAFENSPGWVEFQINLERMTTDPDFFPKLGIALEGYRYTSMKSFGDSEEMKADAVGGKNEAFVVTFTQEETGNRVQVLIKDVARPSARNDGLATEITRDFLKQPSYDVRILGAAEGDDEGITEAIVMRDALSFASFPPGSAIAVVNERAVNLLFQGSRADIGRRMDQLGRIFAMEYLGARDAKMKHILIDKKTGDLFRIDWEYMFFDNDNVPGYVNASLADIPHVLQGDERTLLRHILTTRSDGEALLGDVIKGFDSAIEQFRTDLAKGDSGELFAAIRKHLGEKRYPVARAYVEKRFAVTSSAAIRESIGLSVAAVRSELRTSGSEGSLGGEAIGPRAELRTGGLDQPAAEGSGLIQEALGKVAENKKYPYFSAGGQLGTVVQAADLLPHLTPQGSALLLDQLTALYQETHGGEMAENIGRDFTKDEIRKAPANSETAWHLFVDAQGTIAGQALIRYSEADDNYYLKLMGVSARLQRLGIGKFLLLLSIEEAVRRNAVEYVILAEARALEMYDRSLKSLGFPVANQKELDSLIAAYKPANAKAKKEKLPPGMWEPHYLFVPLGDSIPYADLAEEEGRSELRADAGLPPLSAERTAVVAAVTRAVENFDREIAARTDALDKARYLLPYLLINDSLVDLSDHGERVRKTRQGTRSTRETLGKNEKGSIEWALAWQSHLRLFYLGGQAGDKEAFRREVLAEAKKLDAQKGIDPDFGYEYAASRMFDPQEAYWRQWNRLMALDELEGFAKLGTLYKYANKYAQFKPVGEWQSLDSEGMRGRLAEMKRNFGNAAGETRSPHRVLVIFAFENFRTEFSEIYGAGAMPSLGTEKLTEEAAETLGGRAQSYRSLEETAFLAQIDALFVDVKASREGNRLLREAGLITEEEYKGALLQFDAIEQYQTANAARAADIGLPHLQAARSELREAEPEMAADPSGTAVLEFAEKAAEGFRRLSAGESDPALGRDVASAVVRGVESSSFAEFLDTFVKSVQSAKGAGSDAYIRTITAAMADIAARISASYPDAGATFVLSPSGDRTRLDQSRVQSYSDALKQAAPFIDALYYHGFVENQILKDALSKAGTGSFQPVSNLSQVRAREGEALIPLLKGDTERRAVNSETAMMQIGLLRDDAGRNLDAQAFEESFAVFMQFVFGFVAAQELGKAENKSLLNLLNDLNRIAAETGSESADVVLEAYTKERGISREKVKGEIKLLRGALIRPLGEMLGERVIMVLEGLELGAPNVAMGKIEEFMKAYQEVLRSA